MTGKPATPTLAERIRGLIGASGPLRFRDYMSVALYDPQQGYYAGSTAQVGRGGDFFTSVSVGPLFGRMLARRFAAEWRRLGEPGVWRVTECGAHDGRLALDILDELRTLEPDAYLGLQYAVVEPLASLRSAQQRTLARHESLLRQTAEAGSLDALPGVVFGNEVLDALPCHLVERRDGRWQECAVVLGADGQLGWHWLEPQDPLLVAMLDELGHDFPDGYRTELRSNIGDFLTPLIGSLAGGLMLWIDYGFEREDYYHPDRREGTLRTFFQHRAGTDPLLDPGSLDISAHVDFTAVSRIATSMGGRALPLRSQGIWLTELAREWLLAQEGQPDPGAIRQFQTLTHPAHLGRSFQILEINF